MIFETAMMQVFDYYRKNEAYTAELYWLIWLFEKVPTASNPTHFEKLTDTLNQGELQDRSSRGISLHYVLLNVLFEYDNAQVFQPIFLYEVTFQTDPLFFQAALRYFSRSPEYFVRFMDRVCQRFQEPEPTIISMIAHTFNEILEVEKTKEPVTYWFKISSKGLKENKFFDRLKTETKEILDDADHPTVTRFMAVMREIEGQNRLANSRPQKAGLMLPSSDTSIRASA
ncbi:MAG: hypothetical protein EAZ91_18420 [Cytophagales bacterium]|nr:MAG: hypothetical protein EAZ91_18420 [Cytophagales bacterium]